jgi:hypothetical protein
MESFYRINVARPNGLGWDGKPAYVHYFAVEVRHTKQHAVDMAADFRSKFTDCKVNVTFWDCGGIRIDF